MPQVEELPVLILVHIMLTGQLDGLIRLGNRWERSVCIAQGIGNLAVRAHICSTGHTEHVRRQGQGSGAAQMPHPHYA